MNGLLLGAGASCELGLPLVPELTNQLKSAFTPEVLRQRNETARARGLGFPDEVIENTAAVLGRADMNYEAVLGYLLVHYLRPSPNQQHYHNMYSYLVEHIYKVLYLRHRKKQDEIVAGLRLLSGMTVLAETNQPLWIFSLNHDVIVECLAAAYSIPVSCGFVDHAVLPRRNATGQKVGDLPVEVIPFQRFQDSGLTFLPYGTRGINLLKVHGGLDLFTLHDGRDLLRITALNNGPAGPIASLYAANEELLYIHEGQGIKIPVTNEIGFTDDSGEMQFLRRSLLAGALKFDPRHQQVLPDAYLGLFVSNLNFVSSLTCVGYSLGDFHINSVILKWLEFDQNRRLEIVTPAVRDIPSFLAHLSPQITLTASTASNYCAQFTA